MNKDWLTSWWKVSIVSGVAFALLTLVFRGVMQDGVTVGDASTAALAGLIYGLLMGPWTARARTRAQRRGASGPEPTDR